ncbi:hypothetical protein A6R68_02966, partial [Neotoma lepida]
EKTHFERKSGREVQSQGDFYMSLADRPVSHTCGDSPLAGPSGSPRHNVYIIDEIGKMELFSQPFIQAVRQTLSTPGTVVLGTIPVPKGKPLALVEEIRNRHDVKVFSVTKENRNSLLPDIVTCVQSSRT